MNLPEVFNLDSLNLGVCSTNWTAKEVQEFDKAVVIESHGRVNFSVDEKRLPIGHPARGGNYGLGDMVGVYVERIANYAIRTKGICVGEY